MTLWFFSFFLPIFLPRQPSIIGFSSCFPDFSGKRLAQDRVGIACVSGLSEWDRWDNCSTWIFWGSVHRPTIGIQIHSSDHRHHLRSLPGRIVDRSWVQTAKMATGNARMSHTCHTCHTPLWGVSCSKTSSVFTFSQILRLSDPKNDSMKLVSMWRVEKCLHDACVYHIIHLADLAHAYDALVMCFGWQDFRLELILPTWLMNWPLFSIGKLLLSRKRCMWNKYNILATEPRPRKRRSFPPTRSQRELGGWK